MEFFIANYGVPRLPPEETRILDLSAEPYPDGKRIRNALELTPCQQRPYTELTLTACLSYPKLDKVDQRELTLRIPGEAG